MYTEPQYSFTSTFIMWKRQVYFAFFFFLEKFKTKYWYAALCRGWTPLTGSIPAVCNSAFRHSPEATGPRVRVRTAGAGGRCQDVRLGLVRVACETGSLHSRESFLQRDKSNWSGASSQRVSVGRHWRQLRQLTCLCSNAHGFAGTDTLSRPLLLQC